MLFQQDKKIQEDIFALVRIQHLMLPLVILDITVRQEVQVPQLMLARLVIIVQLVQLLI